MLPYDIIFHIASYADLDARRALGVPPRKLNPTLLATMEAKLTRKYLSQHKQRCLVNDHHIDAISSIIPIYKDPETRDGGNHPAPSLPETSLTKACYVVYYINIDTVMFTFYEGIMTMKHIPDEIVVFNTRDLIRGNMITTDGARTTKVYKSSGLYTGVTAYNMKILR